MVNGLLTSLPRFSFLLMLRCFPVLEIKDTDGGSLQMLCFGAVDKPMQVNTSVCVPEVQADYSQLLGNRNGSYTPSLGRNNWRSCTWHDQQICSRRETAHGEFSLDKRRRGTC